jgi:hypothetical protein
VNLILWYLQHCMHNGQCWHLSLVELNLECPALWHELYVVVGTRRIHLPFLWTWTSPEAITLLLILSYNLSPLHYLFLSHSAFELIHSHCSSLHFINTWFKVSFKKLINRCNGLL